MKRYKVSPTTNSSGDVTAYSPRLSGVLYAVHYVPDGTSPFANTADLTITDEATGQPLISRTNVSAAFVANPRTPTSAADGTASLYASGGTAIQDRIALANSRIKIVVAQGGDTKTGAFHFLVD